MISLTSQHNLVSGFSYHSNSQTQKAKELDEIQKTSEWETQEWNVRLSDSTVRAPGIL